MCGLCWSCSEQNAPGSDPKGSGDELGPEWYAGGKLGTTFNATSTAYEDPTPAIEEAGLDDRFKSGEFFFERPYTQHTKPFLGLGPLYTRTSCQGCHPGYGRGKRITRYRSNEWGNGCLLAITNQEGEVISSLSLLPHTLAVEPFKPMIDETKISIKWHEYTDDWGNRFDDGERYSLIYPEVTIPEDAFYVPIRLHGKTVPFDQLVVRIENTIGFFGVGLLEAIDPDSILAQYRKEAKYLTLNPNIFKNGEWAALDPATKMPYRFDYILDRSGVMSDAGLWEALNVTRPEFRSHYFPAEYAEVASKDPDVQKEFYRYFPEWNKTGNIEKDIFNYLTCTELPVEMPEEDYVNFMVWQRGLAVPAARDLDKPEVQRGKQLFSQIGCATCHRPSWRTGEDKIKDPYGRFTEDDPRLPRYPHQTIWPYTDMVQHRLYMKNDLRTHWCRTTPLWGRGLMRICAGHDDRLHDARARNVIEAIMWHGCTNEGGTSDARWSVEKFRKLNKADRDCIVQFINSI